MRRLTQSYFVLVGLVLLVLALTGCQPVSDARAEFCQTLRDVGTSAAELKSAKIDQPVDQVKAAADSLQQKRTNLDRLARLTSIPSIVKLDAAVDSGRASRERGRRQHARPGGNENQRGRRSIAADVY